jgi:hypothetical protein
MINKIHIWHHTKTGFLVFAGLELAFAYGFFSLSLDRGNLWWYLLTIIFFIGFIQNIYKLIGSLFHGQHKTR